ncbi:DNA repair protein RecO [Aliikangiella sp. IMCC44359]|uniref:DNA repair protein RecO n=1 Tax=Aliikangiella sp. IMCC44359 TaxID=3459125 RepID=UPI00403ACB29
MSQNAIKLTAFILHSKAYQESHSIYQIFSLQQGRFSVIAKGVKNKRSQARKAALQPFSELLIEVVGKSELKTLTHCEVVNPQSVMAFKLTGKALACAYYVNELIIRALPEHQEFPNIFQSYRLFLNQLVSIQNYAVLLRQFEFELLTEIGIAPDFEFDILAHPIKTNNYYHLIPQSGFSLVNSKDRRNAFKGSSILAIASGKFEYSDLQETKQIMRFLLQEIIGNRPLQSRKLWHHITYNQS